jgi:peroxiredoxin Q/BCP
MTTLKEGAKAPAFTATDQDGNKVSLSDYAGQKVALFFYPKDNTPGCTTQACNLRDNYDALTGHNIAILGVSTDGQKSHKKFEEKHDLLFPLLVDEDHKLVEKYKVWGEKHFMGRTYDGTHRTTFLVNEEGRIAHIITKVKTKEHAHQILELWGLL